MESFPMRPFLSLLLVASVAVAAEPVSHSFLATGAETAIFDADGKAVWKYDHPTRDGWVLESGNVLLALSKSKAHPHGAVVEVTREGKTVFAFEGTQAEVNTVQPLGKGRVLLTEAGDKPRLLEVNADGKVEVDVPLDAQTKDHHLQTRMARKLANGNYLVPQYDAKGKVVWEAKTPDMPFTAIRLEDGNTLVACTRGNLLVELDDKGKTVWQLTNDDLDGKPIKDACGAQRLPNGNTVFASYASKAKELRLIEVTREKKVVWTLTDDRKAGIHHFHILDTNGKKLEGTPLR
jgi:hypothetical protein